MSLRFCPVHQCLVSPPPLPKRSTDSILPLLTFSSVESTPASNNQENFSDILTSKVLELTSPSSPPPPPPFNTKSPLTVIPPLSESDLLRGLVDAGVGESPLEPRKRRARAISSSNNPPRPLNCFMAYRQYHLANIARNHPKADNRQISRIAGAMWNVELEDVKAFWRKQAELGKKEHARLYPDYKYRPKKRRSTRSIFDSVGSSSISSNPTTSSVNDNNNNINENLGLQLDPKDEKRTTTRRRAFTIATSKPSENTLLPADIERREEELWQSWNDILDFPGWKDAGNPLVEEPSSILEEENFFNTAYLTTFTEQSPTLSSSLGEGSICSGAGGRCSVEGVGEELIKDFLLNIQTPPAENPLFQHAWNHDLFEQVFDEDAGTFWNEICSFSQEREEERLV